MKPKGTPPTLCAWLLAVAVAAAADASAQPVAPALPDAVDALQWLEGTWLGTSGAARLEERWTPPAGGAMLATSRTLVGDRMVGFEFLRIVARGGSLFYVAQPGGRPPVEFRLTSAGPGRAVFENPAHDHPKVIRYTRVGDVLTAEIEGDENGAPARARFEFRRSR